MIPEEASLPRAAQRIAWASRALVAAAGELHALGASAAGEVIADEADRVDGLAGEVSEMAKAQ